MKFPVPLQAVLWLSLLTAGSFVLCASLATPSIASSPMDDGITAFNAGQYDKAVSLFGQAEPTNFNDPVFHYYLGSALVKLNHKPDAIKQFKLALDLEPSGQVADYCKKALANLADKKTKGGRGDGKSVSGQTPQLFAAECGCPLCEQLDTVLHDVHRVYGDRIFITRCVQVGKSDWLPVADAAKNLAIMDRYNVKDCPTLLFFSDSGNLVAQMSGPIAERDIWRQLQAMTTQTAGSQPSPGDSKVDEMRASIMSDEEAKLSASKKLEEDELRQLERRYMQERNDLTGVRGAWGVAQQLQSDYERRRNEIQSDFEKRRKQIVDEAKSRTDGIGR